MKILGNVINFHSIPGLLPDKLRGLAVAAGPGPLDPTPRPAESARTRTMSYDTTGSARTASGRSPAT